MTKTETIEAWIGVDADGERDIYEAQPAWKQHRQFYTGATVDRDDWFHHLCKIPVEPGTCQKVRLTLTIETDGEPVKGE